MSTRLRALREEAGLTQSDLAARAGVSRQLIGAAEAGRHIPRVDAALAIAAAIGADVAALFSTMAPPLDVVSGTVPADATMVRAGRVGDQTVTVPAGIGSDGWDAGDGIVERGNLTMYGRAAPGLVVAGCEPGLGVLERILREGGMGALAATSSSTGAIAALNARRVHAAVVHGPEGTVGSRVSARAVDRFRIARWRVGLAAPPDASPGWWGDAVAGKIPVVQREAGAGVQRTFEELAGVAVPGPRVATHLAAALRAVLTGMPAVTIEPAALAAGATFHPLDIHEAELWIDPAWMTDRLVGAAMDVIAGRRFQVRLEAVGGYDLAGCGSRVA